MYTVFEGENSKPLVSAQMEILLRQRWICLSVMLIYLER